MKRRSLLRNSATANMLLLTLSVICLTLSQVSGQFDASLFDDGFSKGSQASSMDQFGTQDDSLYQSQSYDKSKKRMQYRQAGNVKSTTQKPGNNKPTGQPQASRMADAQIAYNQLSQPNAALLGQQSVYMNDQGGMWPLWSSTQQTATPRRLIDFLVLFWCILFLSLSTHVSPVFSQLVGSEKTMEQFLDRLLHESVYDRRIRPFYTDSKNSKPVEVLMNMHINTISGISEVNMEYIVDCYFRQEWYDPRLMYSNSSWKHVEDITLHYDLVNKVWTPDAFFRNSKDAKSHMITVPNRLIRIFPEGRVLFSQRLTLRLECPMKLQKFPLDNQTCVINIGSFGYTLKDIKFDWSAVAQPVTINSKLEMPDFILTTHNSSVCKRHTSTGAYACLEVKIELQRDLSSYINEIYIPSGFVCFLSFISFLIDYKSPAARAPLGATNVLTITTMLGGSYACLEVHFYLKRSFGYYLVQVYIPSILTCLISFVSFWVDHRAVPARISVGLLTVLTITTQSSGIRSQLPKVSYIKAIDVWMSACLVFVFAALLEYAVVNVIARKQELKKLVKLSEKHKQERKMNLVNKSSVLSPNNEKVMAIGNRLANLNAYKKSDLEAMSGSQEALETLLQPVAPASASFKRKPYSQSSLHVDSAVSISAVSQQSNSALAPSPALTQPPPPSSTLPAGPIRDDAQMVDFVSSFLFPISFIVFNIIYWMVYLNMQVHSGN